MRFIQDTGRDPRGKLENLEMSENEINSSTLLPDSPSIPHKAMKGKELGGAGNVPASVR